MLFEKKTRSRWALVFVGGIFCLFIAVRTGFFQWVLSGIRWATLPVTKGLTSFSFGVTQSMGRNASTPLETRLVDCQRDLRAVQVDYVHLRALEEENAQLKNLAHVLERKPYTSVGAQVIRREVYGDRALFTIDRGARDGVEMGQAVINDQGFFIGSISRLEKDMAQVQLLMDPQSRIAASLLGKETLVGVLEGRGMGAALLRYIPLTAKVEKGQILVTAGTDEKIPAALPLGAVALVQGKETDPFLEAIIELFFDVAQTQIVSVLIPTRSAP